MAEENKPITKAEILELDKNTTKRFQYSTAFRNHKIMKAKMARKSRKINRSKKW
jgi:hypothetical protein